MFAFLALGKKGKHRGGRTPRSSLCFRFLWQEEGFGNQWRRLSGPWGGVWEERLPLRRGGNPLGRMGLGAVAGQGDEGQHGPAASPVPLWFQPCRDLPEHHHRRRLHHGGDGPALGGGAGCRESRAAHCQSQPRLQAAAGGVWPWGRAEGESWGLPVS